jgi:hypothetical protein
LEVVGPVQGGRLRREILAELEDGIDESSELRSISPCEKGHSSIVSDRPGSRSGICWRAKAARIR